MSQNKVVIGIDTSAYTTSVAAVDQEGDVIFDIKRILDVPHGMRGLRQSAARGQHHQNLNEIISTLSNQVSLTNVCGVAVSDKPRPVIGSYMPVFMDGVEKGAQLANQLGVPIYYFSHQEGHIEAIKHFSSQAKAEKVLCFHLSGGTSELLLVDQSKIQIIGGSKDISFGQVIDRVGVRLGMTFPSGSQMDQMAFEKKSNTSWLKPIFIEGLRFNLSGIESQCQRRIDEGIIGEVLVPELFQRIAKCLAQVCDLACIQEQIQHIIMAGGVSGSKTVQDYLSRYLKHAQPVYGEYSSDNAVGIALLGGKILWQ